MTDEGHTALNVESPLVCCLSHVVEPLGAQRQVSVEGARKGGGV